MLTAMCPNCRHRFPVPGCCNPSPQIDKSTMQADCCGYYGSILVPRGYNGGGCFINAPTIIHGPTIIQSNGYSGSSNIELWRDSDSSKSIRLMPDVQIHTSCDLTGGTVTITTPRIQSGGCLIQSTDDGFIVQAPRIEIRPKLTGGGSLVQKRLSTDFTETACNFNYYDDHSPIRLDRMQEILVNSPPSGCQELPGTRHSETRDSSCCSPNSSRNSSTSPDNMLQVGTSSESSPVQIQVNATVQLPPNVGHCTLNITATANPRISDNSVGTPTTVRVRNSLNGGGLVSTDDTENERRNDSPTTPISWLAPCPWGFDNYMYEKDAARLQRIKRLLQTTAWYHEGISWQQSEKLLKNLPVGYWLLRNSSDSRYVFAVSVQTKRGPTSVRIVHSYGRFRLDAEPSLAHAMPTFDCPIKMLQYYIEYSKTIEEKQRHVWVDYSGLLFSHIYLTEPLVKEVRSLSHLARLALDKSTLSTDNLPAPIMKYINEYPYSF